MADTVIRTRGLRKAYRGRAVLDGIDLDVERGEVVTLIGRSGAGKTTLLRMLNLLESPDEGTIEVDGVEVDARTSTKQQRRALRDRTAMVFQHYNLFANKTALENVTLSLRCAKGMGGSEADELGRGLLERVGLAEKADEFPAMLSGGQQQRVGIARALAVNPSVILFDEPTSALDPEWVGGVLRIIRQIADEGMTMVVVSHEMRFVRGIATRVVFLGDGGIVEDGTPEQVLEHPRDPRTTSFMQEAGFMAAEDGTAGPAL